MSGLADLLEATTPMSVGGSSLADKLSPIQPQFVTPQPLNNVPTQPIDPKDLEPAPPNPALDITSTQFAPEKVAMSGASNLIKQSVDKALSPEAQTAVVKATKPIRTGLQMAGTAIEAPNRAIKSLTYEMENMGNELDDQGRPTVNPLKAAGQGFMNNRQDSWGDIIASDPKFMQGMPEQVRRDAANKVGLLPEFLADPAMYLKIGGLTKAGETAAQTGKLGATAMQDLASGNRATLSLGNQTLIPGKVISTPARIIGGGLSKALDLGEELPLVGKTIGKARSLADTLREGFNPMTNNAEFNALKQSQINKTNYQTLLTNLDTPENARIIRDNAESAGVTPDEMKKKMLDYIEPPGSQMEIPKNVPRGEEMYPELSQDMMDTQRDEFGKTLPPEIKALADEIRGIHETRAGIEQSKGLLDTSRDNYIEHAMTPDAKEFMDKTFNNDDKVAIADALKANQKREIPLTINETNDLFGRGQGHTIPELGEWPQLKNFKGKFFNDQVEELAADRYLRSVKAENDHDFHLAAGKAYGKTTEYIKANEDPKDWIKVSHDAFKQLNKENATGETKNTLWFPKEIGNYLNRSEQLTSGKYIEPFFNVLRGLNNFTKKMNFGIWPGSAVKIELGNQKLAFLSDLWSPHSQWVGHSIATKIRQGGMNALDDKIPVISTPRLGALTEKQIYQLAMEHRGIGMGLFRGELASMKPESQELGIAKAGWELHNYVEDGTRMGTFIDALKKGYDANGAGIATQKALYDYSKLGPIPDVARRFMPFFTFAYKNAPAMVSKLATNPGKMALYDKARQIINQPVKNQEQYEDEWQSDNMPVYMGTGKDGKNYYLYGNKFMPETDMNAWMGSGKTWQEALGNTPEKMLKYAFGLQNPYIKTLIEEGFNKSVYFDQALQRMKGEVAQTGLGFNAPAKVAYGIRNTIRAPSEAGKLTDETVNPALRVGRLLSGVNIQAVDPFVQQLNYARKMQQAIKGSGGRFGGEADVEYYASLYAHYLQNDDKAKADLALKNLETAKKNLEETTHEMMGE